MRDNHHIYYARPPRLLVPKIAFRRISAMLGHLHLLFPFPSSGGEDVREREDETLLFTILS